MQHPSDFEWATTEDHCYFPEWADIPVGGGTLHELDRNSYLAGGYAEEFGHRAPHADAPASSIPAESAEDWRLQTGCLHPGYPECPRPLDREPATHGDGVQPDDRRRAHRHEQSKSGSRDFRVLVVGHTKEASRHRGWSLWRELRMRRRRLPLG